MILYELLKTEYLKEIINVERVFAIKMFIADRPNEDNKYIVQYFVGDQGFSSPFEVFDTLDEAENAYNYVRSLMENKDAAQS